MHELSTPAAHTVRTGAQRLVDDDFAAVAGERVGVLSNHTAVLADLSHLVDVLAASDQVELTAAFGAEHGFRGASQAERDETSFTDTRTGLPRSEERRVGEGGSRASRRERAEVE